MGCHVDAVVDILDQCPEGRETRRLGDTGTSDEEDLSLRMRE